MKRLIAGLTVLGVIIVLSILGMFYADSVVDNITHSLNSAKEAALSENFSESVSLCDRAKERFEENERLFTFFLNHATLEQIKEELSGLTDFATKETLAMFVSSLERAKIKLEELKDSQKLIF